MGLGCQILGSGLWLGIDSNPPSACNVRLQLHPGLLQLQSHLSDRYGYHWTPSSGPQHAQSYSGAVGLSELSARHQLGQWSKSPGQLWSKPATAAVTIPNPQENMLLWLRTKQRKANTNKAALDRSSLNCPVSAVVLATGKQNVTWVSRHFHSPEFQVQSDHLVHSYLVLCPEL